MTRGARRGAPGCAATYQKWIGLQKEASGKKGARSRVYKLPGPAIRAEQFKDAPIKIQSAVNKYSRRRRGGEEVGAGEPPHREAPADSSRGGTREKNSVPGLIISSAKKVVSLPADRQKSISLAGPGRLSRAACLRAPAPPAACEYVRVYDKSDGARAACSRAQTPALGIHSGASSVSRIFVDG